MCAQVSLFAGLCNRVQCVVYVPMGEYCCVLVLFCLIMQSSTTCTYIRAYILLTYNITRDGRTQVINRVDKGIRLA